MAKMNFNKNSGSGFQYFQAYGDGKVRTDDKIETENERLERSAFIERYWSEHGSEAKKAVQAKAQREQEEARKAIQLNAERKQEARKAEHLNDESLPPNSNRNRPRKASKSKTTSAKKKPVLILKLKKTRGGKISIVLDFGLYKANGTYSIDELGEKAKAGLSIDVPFEHSKNNPCKLTLKERYIDTCLQEGEIVEFAWSS